MDEEDKAYVAKKLKVDTPKITKDDIAKLMANTNLSGREIIKTLSIFRSSLGSSAFEANLREYTHVTVPLSDRQSSSVCNVLF